MRILSTVALTVALSTPALCADLVMTSQKHIDAMKMGPQETPAKDTTEVLWVGKDHMRSESGDKVTIVRMDLKKMFMLDTKAKTVSSLDLPVDLSKYVPPEAAPMLKMMSEMKITVTPTTETKKIKDWNTTKYTMTMRMDMGPGVDITQDMWVTKDIPLDRANWQEMNRTMMSAALGTSGLVEEMKKIDGVPVLTERTQTMMGTAVKSRVEVISVEQKDPVAGFYDVPKDFTEKPFNPMEDQMGGMGGGQGRKKAGKPTEAPTEKPHEKPAEKPLPK
jgi:hypothetical protein